MRSVAAAVALLAALGCVPAQSESPVRRSAAELMDVLMWNREAVGGPFMLIDHRGRTRTDTDFRGKLLLISFGFTHCPDICPTDLQEISRALETLGPESSQIQPLFVTLDPERDTADHLADYVSAFHPRLIGLTGSTDAIRSTANAYEVFFEKVTVSKDDYTIDHSAFVYLLDRSSGYLGFFRQEPRPSGR